MPCCIFVFIPLSVVCFCVLAFVAGSVCPAFYCLFLNPYVLHLPFAIVCGFVLKVVFLFLSWFLLFVFSFLCCYSFIGCFGFSAVDNRIGG